nr:hypothetical protein [Burkholderia ubonensis]
MRQRQEVQALSRQAVVRRCPHAHVVRCPPEGAVSFLGAARRKLTRGAR